VIGRDDILAANDATYAAWNAHDPEAGAAVFAEDAELVDAGNPEPVRGREAIRARAVELLDAFGDFHLERLDLVIEPPSNADRWRVTATHVGTFLGIEPTGNRIQVEGATFSRFGDDGLVVSDVNFWDVPGLMAQLSR
jgi:predicted ester cyclase